MFRLLDATIFLYNLLYRMIGKIPRPFGRGPERSGGIALFHKNRENTSIFHFEIRGGAPTELSNRK